MRAVKRPMRPRATLDPKTDRGAAGSMVDDEGGRKKIQKKAFMDKMKTNEFPAPMTVTYLG